MRRRNHLPLVVAGGLLGMVAISPLVKSDSKEEAKSEVMNEMPKGIRQETSRALLPDVTAYIARHPEEHDFLLNSLMWHKSKNSEPYSFEVLDSMATVLSFAAREDPAVMLPAVQRVTRTALDSPYRYEYFSEMSGEECISLFNEVLTYKARVHFSQTDTLAADALDKLQPRELIDKYLEQKETLARDIVDRIKETKVYDDVKQAGQQFYDNVQKRLPFEGGRE